MKKEIFINIEIEDFMDLVRNCVREEIQEIVKNNENTELMKASEVCEYLKISKVTFLKWVKQGKIVGYHLGTRLFFKKSEIINALIDRNDNNK